MQENKPNKTNINKRIYAIALALIAIGVTAYLISGMMNTKAAKTGDTVAVDYIGTLNDGTIFDTSKELVALKNGIANAQRSYEPLVFTIGNGQMIKGFDNAVLGMKVGETKKVTLQPQDAYGNIRQDLIVTVNASDIQTSGQPLYVGGHVLLENGGRGVVTALENGKATIDFNHPLAGKALNFEITLVNISAS